MSWDKLTLSEQLGNIGSEVGRALKARQKSDRERERLALERALSLFDKTLADKRWRGRYKEIARARSVVVDYFTGNSFRSDPKSLDNYFLHFGLAARLNR